MRIKKILILIFLILLPVFARLYYLRADIPPTGKLGTHNADEGTWAHNARNKILFGSWFMENDEWNPLFVSPPFSLLAYSSFWAFGPGIVQARLVSVLFSLLTMLFFYRALRNEFGMKTAIIGIFLLSCNFVYLAFSRAVMLEVFSIFFLVLTFYFFQKCPKNQNFIFLVAVSSFLAFIAKPSNLHFFPVVFISTYALAFKNFKRKEFKLLIRPYAILAGVWAIMGIIYLLAFLLPFYDFVKMMLIDTYFVPRSSSPLIMRVFNILTIGFDKYTFARMPFVSLTAFVFFIFLAGRILSKFGKVEPLNFFAFNWIAFSFLYFFFFDSPMRRMVQIIPPFIFLSAQLLSNLRRSQIKLNLKGRMQKIIIPLLWFFLLYSIIGNMLRFGLFEQTGFLIRQVTSFFHNKFSFNLRSYFVASLLSLIFSFAVALPVFIYCLIFKGKVALAFQRFWRVISIHSKAFIIIALAGEFLLFSFQFHAFVFKAEDSYYRASLDLGNVIANEKIQGRTSPAFTMENNNIPVNIEPGFANYKNRFNRTDISYFMLVLKRHCRIPDGKDDSGLLISDPDVNAWMSSYPNSTLVWAYNVSDSKEASICLFKKGKK